MKECKDDCVHYWTCDLCGECVRNNSHSDFYRKKEENDE